VGTGKKIMAHDHEYVEHPDPDWDTHLVCRICGFAVPKHSIWKLLPKQIVRDAEGRIAKLNHKDGRA
jgi:hypothetical protein